MVDILHRVGIKAPLDEVYKALVTREGLAAWWTRSTTGEGGRVGGALDFRFEAGGVEIGGFVMKVLALEPGQHVLWQVDGGPEDWIGTRIDWSLKQEGEHVIVLFKHQGWQAPVEAMHHCSTKWAVFLMSLKSLLETGKGSPSPDDVKIDNWN